MEALVPALIIALLSEVGDRPPLLAAILADRLRRPASILLAAALAHSAGNAIAAAIGAALAPILTPEARSLLLALAFCYAGVTGMWVPRLPASLDRWRLGSFATVAAALLMLVLAERTQFFTFALSARSYPWLAATGSTLGATIISATAASLGEARWSALPIRLVRRTVAILFLCIGIVIGLGALRLF